MGVCQN